MRQHERPQPITLDLLAREQAQVIAELASMRDDLRVMAATVQRLGGTLGALLDDVRAMHARYGPLARRVEALKGRAEVLK